LTVSFAQLDLPELEPPGEVPELEPSVFRARFRKLEAAREAAGLDALLVYADREHAANLEWLTGFSPRFEEALWVQGPGPRPALLLGNENLGYARTACRLEADLHLYQPFSLPDQDRSRSSDLVGLLRRAGLGRGFRVGLVGWKPMRELEVPHFVVRAVEEITGLEPVNAAHLLMDPRVGLRATLEPEMVALCEYAARITSRAIRDLVFGLRPGLREREAALHLASGGLELSCHPMVNFARSIPSGLRSPRNGRAERGGYAQAAFGVIGSLTCRAGRLVTRDDPDEDGYLDLVFSYLEAVRAWYATLAVGVTGGEVAAAVEGAKADTWDLALNPGHLIHLDEWLASPFRTGSQDELRSGMAIQQDLIPVPREGDAVVNMEDGLVLADAEFRGRLDPGLLRRCEARRAFMERLGYDLPPDVLPLSDIAGAYFPFLLEPAYLARFD
jgi:hypothetical protein